MDGRQFLIVVITLMLATAFLFIWKRRDAGIVPEDRLPEALHERLDGRQPPSRADVG